MRQTQPYLTWLLPCGIQVHAWILTVQGSEPGLNCAVQVCAAVISPPGVFELYQAAVGPLPSGLAQIWLAQRSRRVWGSQASRVVNSSWFVQDFPSLSTASLTLQETLRSQAKCGHSTIKTPKLWHLYISFYGCKMLGLANTASNVPAAPNSLRFTLTLLTLPVSSKPNSLDLSPEFM